MLGKKAIKDIQSLKQKKSRNETGLFVAEGPKLVAEIRAAAPQLVRQLYATPEWLAKNVQNDLPVIEVSETELQRISFLEAPNEVLAVVQQLPVQLPANNKNIIIYLDAISDPGNLGSIIRIADWFGCSAVVCSPGCADVYNPKVVQATMGSLFRVPVCYAANSAAWLADQKEPKLAATLNGKNIYQQKLNTPLILMIGSEAHGLSAATKALATYEISIPKMGGAESLNAAVATGIIVAQLTNGNV